MPSGDAGRTWFPEMLDELKKKWEPSTSWEEYSRLCDEITKVRKKIRKEKGIKPVNIWCENCQAYHNMEPIPITIRSLLFALKKIILIDDKELKELDSEWKKYRKKNKLDAYGNRVITNRCT